MAETLEQLAEHIKASVPSVSAAIAYGELTLTVPREDIVKTLVFLRDDPECAFAIPIDICGADHPSRARRFDVVYHLLSVAKNRRVRVKTEVGENETVPSAIPAYPAANWFEREAFDMYGILFSGHPDLRRLLTDYGFEGHPLRKDFPLTGYVEVRFDDEQKRVVYEPVKLVQEFRDFDFLSPWEGAPYILSDGTKAEPQKK
jgi:NADH-quinone oxidoreductase subunit C